MAKQTAISCEEALERVFEYLDRALEEAEYCDIEDHLSVCRSCYSRVEFERRLKDHLHELGTEKVPAALEEKVLEIVQRYPGKSRAG
jgi:mycothiol system anti-sigma-R factor